MAIFFMEIEIDASGDGEYDLLLQKQGKVSNLIKHWNEKIYV